MRGLPAKDEEMLINSYHDKISENSDYKFVRNFIKNEGVDMADMAAEEADRVDTLGFGTGFSDFKVPKDQSNNSMGFQIGKRSGNVMLEAKDPVKSVRSVISMDSAALERINERNANRLARLENSDLLNGSDFFDKNSQTSAKQTSSIPTKLKVGLPPKVISHEQR